MQSARAGSFGLESRPLSATVPPFIPLGPPPGLFILGPVPSIIRCWLSTNFSNESLLYAAVCTASFKSVIDWQMVASLGLRDRIQNNRDGQETVKMQVFLPEATIQHSSSRSSSPAPQLPAVTVDFVVQHSSTHEEAIQIFIGCDVLRARNADIHFSLDRLTLLDDERNKLSVPLVRPENVMVFQSLVTTDSRLIESVASPQAKQQDLTGNEKATEASQPESALPENEVPAEKLDQTSTEISSAPTTKPSVIGQGRKSLGEASRLQTTSNTRVEIENESLANGSTPDTPTRQESGNVWGSWRRDSTQSGRPETQLSNNTSSSNYQRAGRGRGMKVLKPARLNTSRASSTVQQQAGVDTTPGRFSEAGKWPSPSAQSENQDPRNSAADRRFSGGAKSPLQTLGTKATKSNPIGGASAFGWLNSAQQKHSDAGMD